MTFLLRLKHWQMFLLLVLLPIFQSGSIFGIVTSVLWFAIWIGWIYTIGTALYDKLPAGNSINTIYFQISCMFVFGYMTIVAVLFPGGYNINQDNYTQYGNWLWIIIPLHLYLMWSLLYACYFAAKMLMSVLEKKVVGFSQSFGYFFAVLYFPIGVWYIQPKLQKIFSKTTPWENT